MKVVLDERELATVQAALHLWQNRSGRSLEAVAGGLLAAGLGRLDPLRRTEVDALIAHLGAPQREYEVSWEIEVDGEDPHAAAVEALAIQRDPTSIATVFKVRDKQTGETVVVDLGGGTDV